MSSAITPADRRQRIDRAWSWLESALTERPVPPLLAVIGLGDGSLLDALDEHAPGTRVLALEPDARQAQARLTAREWEAWRQSGRLVYLSDPDYAGADQAWRIFPEGITAPPVLVHPDLARDEASVRAAQCLKGILYGVEANAEARRKFAPRYLVNSIRNLPAIVAGSDVRHLAGAYRGIPAIIAGAGPSLDVAIADLRDQRGLLIAADTALRPLLAGGVSPHLVVALDPSHLNARHLLSLPQCRDTWLVSESALDRQATAIFDGRTFWFRVSQHHPWPWFNELGLDAGLVNVWGSVLTGAFQVAVLAGCDPIIMVGADLSFTGERPYARGTTYELDWAGTTSADRPLTAIWEAVIADGMSVPDLRGEQTRTGPTMLSVRDWMRAQAARCGRRVVNATGAGILYGDGLEQAARLSDVLSPRDAIPPVAACARRAQDISPSAVATRVRETKAIVSSGAASTRVTEWTAFSGGVFDAAAVSAALDEAAHGLDTARTPTYDAVLPWDQTELSRAMGALLPRLPEAIGRMPPGPLGGPAIVTTATEPVVRADDRARRLQEAWALLGAIYDAALRGGDDLQMVDDVWRIGTRRVSSLYDWPEALRWAVVMFEGLLGETWATEVSHAARPSCTRALLTGIDVAERSSTPNTACACALLALEWLRCAGADPNTCGWIAESLRADAVRLSAGGEAARVRPGVPFAVDSVRRGASVDLRLSLSPPLAALMSTGRLEDAAVNPGPEPRRTADLPAALALAGIEISGLQAHADAALVRPRRLTRDDGFARLFVAYPTPDGVVCVRPHTCESVIVDRNGAIRPHRTWPRAIGMELPYGKDGGGVAWSNGLAHSPDVEPAYVMYRRSADTDVVVEPLPFRPAYGQWHDGRLYWSCFSSVDGWQGLASWAPDEGTREEASGVTAWAILRDTADLVAHPCDFTPAEGFRRRLHAEGWKLPPGHPLEPVALGPDGAASSRDTREAWTATAHPDVDVVRLESPGRHPLSLMCPSPLGLAWLDTSLFVSTLQGELLLFDDLLAIAEQRASPSKP